MCYGTNFVACWDVVGMCFECYQKSCFFSFSQVIFLIGNKCDLEAQRDVTYEEAKQFAEENGECVRIRVRGREWCVMHVSKKKKCF